MRIVIHHAIGCATAVSHSALLITLCKSTTGKNGHKGYEIASPLIPRSLLSLGIINRTSTWSAASEPMVALKASAGERAVPSLSGFHTGHSHLRLPNVTDGERKKLPQWNRVRVG